jgi:cell division transport system permease protein
MFITPLRICKQALQHVGRNVWLSSATVLVLILALVSVNVLVGVNALVERSVRMVEDRVDMTVFFRPDANDAVVSQARFFLESLPQVKSVTLIPPDQALTAFRERHQDDPDVVDALAELDTNPLGATLRLTARQTSDYPFIVETLKNPQFGDAIESKTYDDNAESIHTVEQVAKNVRFVGTLLILIFITIGILIVFNTIRVAIYTQREEIGIMRLVGASSSFIRMPFVLQGLLLALVALVVTSGIVAVGVSWMDPALQPLFDDGQPAGLHQAFFGDWVSLVLLQASGLGVLVGFTSWLAAGKYLRR